MDKGRFVAASLFGLVFLAACSLAFFWNSNKPLPDNLTGFELNSPSVEIAGAMDKFRLSGGTVDAAGLASLAHAAKAAPFADEAYTLNAAALIESGQRDKAQSLLKQAIRRDPRSLEARALLIQLTLEEGAISEAVRHIEVLLRFGPQRNELAGILTYLASVPETRIQTLASLSEDQNRAAVLTGLARGGASASMLMNANREIRWDDNPRDPSLFARLVAPLVEDEDFDGAWRLWLSFYPDTAGQSDLLIDPRFTGKFAAPFGWQVSGGQHGFARIEENGLFGQFYGRRSTLLARQLLVWEPGDYAIAANGDYAGEGLQLELACISGAYRTAVPLKAGLRPTLNVTVPSANCGAQYLSVVGVSTDPPALAEFQIRSITAKRSN